MHAVKNSPAFTLINEIGALIGLINKAVALSKGVRGEAAWYSNLAKRQRMAKGKGSTRSAGTAGVEQRGRRTGGASYADVAAFGNLPKSTNLGTGRKLCTPNPPSRGFKTMDGLRASLGRLVAKPKGGAAFVVQAYHSLGWVKGAGQSSPLSSLRRLYAGKLVVTRPKTMRLILERGEAAIRGGVTAIKVRPAAEAAKGTAEAPTSAVVAAAVERAVAKASTKTAKAAKSVLKPKVSRSKLLSFLSKREVALASQWWGLTGSNADWVLVDRATSVPRTRLTLESAGKGRRARLARYLLRCAARLRKERQLEAAVAQKPQVPAAEASTTAVQTDEDGWQEVKPRRRVRSAVRAPARLRGDELSRFVRDMERVLRLAQGLPCTRNNVERVVSALEGAVFRLSGGRAGSVARTLVE